MKSFNTQMFKSNTIYEDVLATIESTKTFNNGSRLEWKEEFTDNSQINGVSYQVQVHYDIMIKGIRIPKTIYTKIVCKGAVADKAAKLKLKSGDKIRFTGEYSARKGTVKWWTSFEILHPNWMEKVTDTAI